MRILSTIIALNTITLAQNNIENFFYVSGDLGYARINNTNDEDGNAEINGDGLLLGMHLGYFVSPNISLGLNLNSYSTSDPIVTFNGVKQSYKSVELANKIIGPFARIQNDTENEFFAELGLGNGTINSIVESYDTFENTDSDFPCFWLSVGKNYHKPGDLFGFGIHLNYQHLEIINKSNPARDINLGGSNFGFGISLSLNGTKEKHQIKPYINFANPQSTQNTTTEDPNLVQDNLNPTQDYNPSPQSSNLNSKSQTKAYELSTPSSQDSVTVIDLSNLNFK